MVRVRRLATVIASYLILVGCHNDDKRGGFRFAADAATAYTRVDRMGMPAIATAVITSKDAYNADNPTDDAGGKYVAEITAIVTALHTGLDDDLTAAGLTPATAANGVAQAAPHVIPDTIKIDTSVAAGFPNGRLLKDQVMDVTLALLLLDLTTSPAPHTVTDLAELPLNPAANDVAFSDTFPYLAAPHEPATFSFTTAAVSSYARVDRMGMPAIATAVITSKDAYNADNPTDDAGGKYVNEITAIVTALHAGLDDDLTAAGLTPATAANGVAQAAPHVIPDTIKIDTSVAAGFPNGRLLTDQVMDVTLALLLLDLTTNPAPHTVTDLAKLPLNPDKNDVAFNSAFPYLAPPHDAP